MHDDDEVGENGAANVDYCRSGFLGYLSAYAFDMPSKCSQCSLTALRRFSIRNLHFCRAFAGDASEAESKLKQEM